MLSGAKCKFWITNEAPVKMQVSMEAEQCVGVFSELFAFEFMLIRITDSKDQRILQGLTRVSVKPLV